ncbi:hypothetical protein R6Q57_027264 [Mikania cordata]
MPDAYSDGNHTDGGYSDTVPALLATGFLTSGGFGMAAATVSAWMYRYVSREQPTGEEALDQRTKGWDAGRGHHATGGVRLTTGARAGLYQT